LEGVVNQIVKHVLVLAQKITIENHSVNFLAKLEYFSILPFYPVTQFAFFNYF